MKKRIVSYFLVLSMMAVALNGCKKSDSDDKGQGKEEVVDVSVDDVNAALEETKPELKIGAYSQDITEEMEGEEISYTYYLLLQDGGKGFMISQDDIILSWDESKILGGDAEYTYEMKDDNTLVLKDGDIEFEYKYIGESLPEDVVDRMPFNLDGTKKIKNQDAADAFEYMLTADIIDFYDYDGSVAYSAEDEEIDTLTAAYFELTDKNIGIILINTPNAIHAVGYAHILQYKDGRISDILGLDEIVMVYKEAGVLVGTYTGGGYGETNYYYYCVDDEEDIVLCAYTSVMENEEYAKAYKEGFGKEFENSYTIGDGYEEGKEVSEAEFEEWLKGIVGDEEPITDFKLRKVKEVF